MTKFAGSLLFLFACIVLLSARNEASAESCIIPKSGPWPACATGKASAPPNSQPLNCRYGTSISFRQDGNTTNYLGIPWLQTTAAGWYVDFGYQNVTPPETNYVRQVRFFPNLKQKWGEADTYDRDNYLPGYRSFPTFTNLKNVAAQNPGSIWIVGNEPDRFKFQDDLQPEVYAQAYHDVYEVIKAADPTAQVATAALVQVTPGRLQYLDLVYNAYWRNYGQHMPVDIWTAHVYPLAEKQVNGDFGPAGIAIGTDPNLAILQSGSSCTNPYDNVYCNAEHDNIDIFKQQVYAMRRWMQQHGYQNTPLMVTEVGVLFPETYDDGVPFLDELGNQFTKQRVINLLTNTSNFLENARDPQIGYPQDNYKLVQQWAWFGMYTDNVGANSNLLQQGWESYRDGDSAALSVVGERFRNEATNQALTANLIIESVQGEQNGDSMRLTATIRNNGNTAVVAPYTVTFYADATMQQPIGSQTIAPILHGCATSVDTAFVDWVPSRRGWQGVWVHVDSAESIHEVSESDNTRKGSILWR